MPRFENKLTSTGPIGFYACAAGRGRLVRLEHRGSGNPPRTLDVDCPNCGLVHEVRAAWRAPTGFDAGKEPELLIGDEAPIEVAR